MAIQVELKIYILKFFWLISALLVSGCDNNKDLLGSLTDSEDVLPIVQITRISLSSSEVVFGIKLDYLGFPETLIHGICASSLPLPTFNEECIISESKSDQYTLLYVPPSGVTIIYVRAFAKNRKGTSYSDQHEFRLLEKINDIDNNIYDVVKIGDQVWMKENLRSSRYRNGDHIMEIELYGKPLNIGGWINNGLYGKLYNYFAVSDNRGICPEGWSVPSIQEYQKLINFLGSSAGHKLKSTNGWNGSNESGFTALPGGYGRFRDAILTIEYSGIYAAFWTTSSIDASESSSLSLYSYQAIHSFISSNNNDGFSVRCIRD